MSYKLAGVIWNDDGTMATKELTPLQALKHFRNQYQGVNVYADDYLDIIETALKALEIIKEKALIDPYVYELLLSKEEFDLLKEVLCGNH